MYLLVQTRVGTYENVRSLLRSRETITSTLVPDSGDTETSPGACSTLNYVKLDFQNTPSLASGASGNRRASHVASIAPTRSDDNSADIGQLLAPLNVWWEPRRLFQTDVLPDLWTRVWMRQWKTGKRRKWWRVAVTTLTFAHFRLWLSTNCLEVLCDERPTTLPER